MKIQLSDERSIPIEMHKISIVQSTQLPPICRRAGTINETSHNTFLLRTKDVFLDI
jgi:tryptophanase